MATMRCALLSGLLAAAAACAVEPDAVVVGVVLEGDAMEGALMALQDVQAERRAHIHLRLFEGDAGSEAPAALEAAYLLAADPEVVAVVGHTNSSASLAASQVYNERKLPQIAPVASADLYSEAGPYSFRLVPADRQQAEFLARHVARLAPGTRSAVVYNNNDYGRGLRERLVAQMAESRLEVIYEAPFLEGGGQNRELSDFASLADAVTYSGADVVLWLGGASELGQFLTHLQRESFNPLVIASDAAESDRLHRNRDGRYTGVHLVRFVDPDDDDARLQELRQRFLTVSGEQLDSESLLAYESLRLVAEAVGEGARTREAVRDYLHALGRTRAPYVGVGGPISFDDKGDNLRPYQLAEVTAHGVRGLVASR